jgi:YHS domain-containing protein
MRDSDWQATSSEARPMAEALDPVCGMRIDPGRSAGTRLVHGASVFFCSSLCLEKFDINPSHYLRDAESGETAVPERRSSR